jgi:hypothetical protein
METKCRKKNNDNFSKNTYLWNKSINSHYIEYRNSLHFTHKILSTLHKRDMWETARKKSQFCWDAKSLQNFEHKRLFKWGGTLWVY